MARVKCDELTEVCEHEFMLCVTILHPRNYAGQVSRREFPDDDDYADAIQSLARTRLQNRIDELLARETTEPVGECECNHGRKADTAKAMISLLWEHDRH